MDITISLTDEELSSEDLVIIRDCLGLPSDTDMSSHIMKLCKSSFMEYCKMFKEKGLPTRADEVQQERLFYMLLHYFENRVPYEHEISGIFQITQSQSRTLLRNTKSRFRTKINSFIRNSIKTILRQAELNDDGDTYEIEITSSVLKDEINMTLSQRNARLYPLSKKRGYLAIYQCPLDTYDFLREEYQIDVEDD